LSNPRASQRDIRDLERDFESSFDLDFPGLAPEAGTLDLSYSLNLAKRVRQLPAVESPLVSDIKYFDQLKTRRQRDLIQRGVSLIDLNLPLEPESFLPTLAMATSDKALDPEPRESLEEPVGMDVTDVGEGRSSPIVAEMALIEEELPPIDLPLARLPQLGTNLEIQQRMKQQEAVALPPLHLMETTRKRAPTSRPHTPTKRIPFGVSESDTMAPTTGTQEKLNQEVLSKLQTLTNLVAAQSQVVSLVVEMKQEIKTLAAEVVNLRSEMGGDRVQLDAPLLFLSDLAAMSTACTSRACRRASLKVFSPPNSKRIFNS
jgi:hypothetical protein